jgi:hypothetical protein
VLLRLFLVLPALLIENAYGGLLLAVGVLGWFSALATARMPLGMRNAGALALRYSARANGYLLILTDAYPYSGPSERALAGGAPTTPLQPPHTEPSA